MANSIQLKNGTTNLYPVTSDTLVYDSNGINLNQKITDINNTTLKKADLSSSVTSTSTTTVATSNAVKQAYDRAEQAFQYANDGKTRIATAIVGKGVSASSSDSFQVLSDKISQIKTGGDFHADLVVTKTLPTIGGVNVTLNTHDFFKQYQIDGGVWQSLPTFNKLEGAGTYTFRARYDTTTESSNITSCTVTLPKGNQQPPADPVAETVTANSITFQSRPAPQELWFNGSKATSNTITGLQTGVAYPAYHRLPATATANEAVSNTLNFYTGMTCGLGSNLKTFTGSRQNNGDVVSVMAVKAQGKVYVQGTLKCSTSNNGIKCIIALNDTTKVSTATSNYNQISTNQVTIIFNIGDTITMKATGSYSGYKYTGYLDLSANSLDVLNQGFSQVTIATLDLLYLDEDLNKLVPSEYAVYYYNEDEDVVYCEYYKTEEEKNKAMLSYEDDDSMKAIKIDHIELNENQLSILNDINNDKSLVEMAGTNLLSTESDINVIADLSNVVRFEMDLNEFKESYAICSDKEV